jgi:hypothetical protein
VDAPDLYAVAADLVLLVHFSIVLFIVLGLLCIFLGRFLSWHWVGNPWFRLSHLAAIAIVVLQSWLGVICPLTEWEMALRARAGEATYEGSFIAFWLHQLMYYRAPAWVFVVCYTVFGAVVLLSWLYVPPRDFRKRPGGEGS